MNRLHNTKAVFIIGAMSLVMINTAGCETANPPPSSTVTFDQTCPEKRPEICVEIYQPVCASRDTGIRCITADCDSTEQKEYANGCKACADKKVYSFRDGPCDGEVPKKTMLHEPTKP